MRDTSSRLNFRPAVILGCLMLGFGPLWTGCASSTAGPAQSAASTKDPAPATAPAQPPEAAASAQSSPGALPTPDINNSIRLAKLMQTRRANEAEAGLVIGPGDLLQISAQDVDELDKRVIRVPGDGTINLPLVGVVHAAGLSEEHLAAEIAEHLTKYMYTPHVQVLVTESYSRQVAVIGAVRSPGLQTLFGKRETILDMLTRSGGTTADAGSEVILFPAEETRIGAGQPLAGNLSEVRPISASAELSAEEVLAGRPASQGGASGPVESELPPGMPTIPPNSHPIVIPLNSTSFTGAGQQQLSLPVRAGDVIVVPGGGQVMVFGWVQNPGRFNVGSGLTALGAIGSAGGPMYAADASEIRLIRSDRVGGKKIINVDLNAIKSGAEPDPPVIANDVIEVPYSDARIGPYIFYNILTRIGIGGLAIPMP